MGKVTKSTLCEAFSGAPQVGRSKDGGEAKSKSVISAKKVGGMKKQNKLKSYD